MTETRETGSGGGGEFGWGREKIPPEGPVVGLSLSYCVRDIADGLMPLERVALVVSATNAPTPARLKRVLDHYEETYWVENPKKAREIAERLMEEGKVLQPRAEGKEGPNVARGHWVTGERFKELNREYGWGYELPLPTGDKTKE